MSATPDRGPVRTLMLDRLSNGYLLTVEWERPTGAVPDAPRPRLTRTALTNTEVGELVTKLLALTEPPAPVKPRRKA